MPCPSHFLCRIGFATYLLSILLFIFIISTGAVFMFYTGLMMVCACAAFGIIIINSPILQVPFGDIHGELVFLRPKFGWAWYLSLFTGLVTIGLAILIWVMNYFMPRRIATVFHHSVVEEDEFFQASFTHTLVYSQLGPHIKLMLGSIPLNTTLLLYSLSRL